MVYEGECGQLRYAAHLLVQRKRSSYHSFDFKVQSLSIAGEVGNVSFLSNPLRGTEFLSVTEPSKGGAKAYTFKFLGNTLSGVSNGSTPESNLHAQKGEYDRACDVFQRQFGYPLEDCHPSHSVNLEAIRSYVVADSDLKMPEFCSSFLDGFFE